MAARRWPSNDLGTSWINSWSICSKESRCTLPLLRSIEHEGSANGSSTRVRWTGSITSILPFVKISEKLRDLRAPRASGCGALFLNTACERASTTLGSKTPPGTRQHKNLTNQPQNQPHPPTHAPDRALVRVFTDFSLSYHRLRAACKREPTFCCPDFAPCRSCLAAEGSSTNRGGAVRAQTRGLHG